MTSRRSFISGLVTATALGAPLIRPSPSSAANIQGYKALVAIWFLGGMDYNDVIFPLNKKDHETVKAVRPNIFDDHEKGKVSREIPNLRALNALNPERGGGRRFGLTPECASLHSMFNREELAIVGRVGPLVEPINRRTFDARLATRPQRLFSHNDQQSAWMTFASEGATLGWAGAFGDAVSRSSNRLDREFLTMQLGGGSSYVTGRDVRPFRFGIDGELPEGTGSTMYRTLRSKGGSRRNADQLTDLFIDHARLSGTRLDNLYAMDLINSGIDGFDRTEKYKFFISDAPPFSTVFPQTKLGKQLQAVATSIAVKDRLVAPRQIFSCAEGGWDTHNDQGARITDRLKEFDDAVGAFRSAMVELGLWDQVTVFTASDFGRSLVENGSGTDHGWGSCHFVMGGSVKGKRFAGDMPTSWNYRDTSQNGIYVGQRGTLIPTTSVETYAASLGAWFGLGRSELRAALPNLGAFPGPNLDLFRS